MTDTPPSPREVIAKTLERPLSTRGADRILNDLERAGYEVREKQPTPLSDRVILGARSMREWFTAKADAILDRIKTETPADVMLYHDAVGLLVAARTMVDLTAAGTLTGEFTPEQKRALSGDFPQRGQ